MKKKLLIIFFLFLGTEKLFSETNNSIIITVGSQPITRLDLIKEIKFIAILSKVNINELLYKVRAEKNKERKENYMFLGLVVGVLTVTGIIASL